MIRAILRAQWLSMRISRLASGRGAVFSVVVAVLWYGFWTVLGGRRGALVRILDRSRRGSRGTYGGSGIADADPDLAARGTVGGIRLLAVGAPGLRHHGRQLPVGE